MIRKKTVVLILVFCIAMSGCTLAAKEMARRKNERVECILNKEDAGLFSYLDTEYQILEKQVGHGRIDKWVGYIRKYAVLDQHYAILDLWDPHLFVLEKPLPTGGLYLVQFFNIYTDNLNKEHLIIDVNGNYHLAIAKEKIGDAQKIEFKSLQAQRADKIKVNPTNCTQIIFETKIYQISNTRLSKNALADYLGKIETYLIFDSQTKKEIPKKDLEKIEIKPNALSRQNRINWIYGEVYSLAGVDRKSSLAVEINNEFMQADVVD